MKTSNKLLLGGLGFMGLTVLILTLVVRMNIVPVEDIPTSGVNITETRDVTAFSEIRVRTPNVKVVTQNGPASCVITGDENVVPLIKTRMDGDKLIVENDENKPFRFTAPVTLTLTSDSWRGIVVSGNDVETIDTISADYFELESNGAGRLNIKLMAQRLETTIRGSSNIYISGQAEKAEISITGAGEFRGEEFLIQNAEANLSGASNAYLNVEKYLDATAYGASEVFYLGNPEVKKSIAGAGGVYRARE